MLSPNIRWGHYCTVAGETMNPGKAKISYREITEVHINPDLENQEFNIKATFPTPLVLQNVSLYSSMQIPGQSPLTTRSLSTIWCKWVILSSLNSSLKIFTASLWHLPSSLETGHWISKNIQSFIYLTVTWFMESAREFMHLAFCTKFLGLRAGTETGIKAQGLTTPHDAQ